MRRSTRSIAVWGRISGAARRVPSTNANTAPASTASAARASSPISEPKFYAIYVEATRMKGDTGENLIGLLERRLDTVVYRAKFLATMFAARQFINHGHIKVNGRRVNISSYKLKPGDLVEIKESSKQLTHVLEASQLGERDVPDFIEADHGKMTAKFTRIPALSDVPFAVQMEPHLIVEFYSR